MLLCLLPSSHLQLFAATAKASEQLKASGCFKTALRGALAAGNFLNYGTRNGSAIGFRLMTLPKLADTKTLDNNSSLLHVSTRSHMHVVYVNQIS